MPRNTGKWSPTEHKFFIKACKKHGTKWSKIALIVKTRDRQQCKDHHRSFPEASPHKKHKQSIKSKSPSVRKPKSATKKTSIVRKSKSSRSTSSKHKATKTTSTSTSTSTSNKKLLYTALYCFSYVAAETIPPLFGPATKSLSSATSVSTKLILTCPSIGAAGSIFGGLLAGQLLDLKSMKNSIPRANIILMAGLLLSAIFNVPLPYSHTFGIVGSYTAMAGLTLGLGIANGLFRAAANTMILRVHGIEAAPYMQALHLFGGGGRLLAPLALTTFPLETAYFYVSSIPVVAALALAILSFLDHDDANANENENQNTISTKKDPIAEKKDKTTTTSSTISLLSIGCIILLFTGAQSTLQNNISLYAEEIGNFSSDEAIQVSALFGTTFTVGRVLSVPLSVRVSPQNMILMNCIGVTVSLFIATSWNDTNSLWLSTGLFGLSMASMFPSILNFAKQMFNVSGNGIGMIMQCGSIGVIIVPLLVVGHHENMYEILLPIVIVANVVFGTLFFSGSSLKKMYMKVERQVI